MTSWHLEEALQLFYIDGESALTAAHPAALPHAAAAASALATAAGVEEAMRFQKQHLPRMRAFSITLTRDEIAETSRRSPLLRRRQHRRLLLALPSPVTPPPAHAPLSSRCCEWRPSACGRGGAASRWWRQRRSVSCPTRSGSALQFKAKAAHGGWGAQLAAGGVCRDSGRCGQQPYTRTWRTGSGGRICLSLHDELF